MMGPGSPHNMACHLVMDLFNIKFVIVNSPSGSGEAATMVTGGHVDGGVFPALGGYGLRDTAVCFGILSDRTTPNMWPEGKLVSETTGVKTPSISVARGFATHASLKTEYPDRYQWLVEKFKVAATDPDFIADCKKRAMSDVMYYFPPEELDEKASTLMKLVDKYSFVFERKKK